MRIPQWAERICAFINSKWNMLVEGHVSFELLTKNNGTQVIQLLRRKKWLYSKVFLQKLQSEGFFSKLLLPIQSICWHSADLNYDAMWGAALVHECLGLTRKLSVTWVPWSQCACDSRLYLLLQNVFNNGKRFSWIWHSLMARNDHVKCHFHQIQIRSKSRKPMNE